MTLQSHGGVPVIDFARVHRADEPRLRQPIPALNTPIENANQTLDKAVVTLNRAGSNPRNPILSGLGGDFAFSVSTLDKLRGVFVYKDRANIGPNFIASVVQIAPGTFALKDHVYGAGVSVAGTPTAGARKNFIRLQTNFGTVEREFWVKSKDADIIALDGKPALDPATLLPVARDFFVVDPSRPWLEIPIDFFVSWNDEFQVLHNAKNPFLDPGFLKAYGGSKFVSFFDTTPGTEGVGTAVNPVTEAPIEDQHIIQVQNTAGLKEITVRFRSKQGSTIFVDCPIEINVIQPPVIACNAPLMGPPETCSAVLFKFGDTVPAEPTPDVPSTPNVQVVAGTPGGNFSKDLLVVTVRGAVVSAGVKLIVRKWTWVQNVQDLSGAEFTLFATDLEFLPLRQTSSSPASAPPYLDPERFTIAFDVLQDRADNVAFYTIVIQDDGGLNGPPMLIVGPQARQISFFPAGGLGGELPCVY